MWHQLFMPARFKKLSARFANKSFKLLDIGCGNHSPSVAKKYFPKCEYHGLDRCKYNLDATDEACIDRFYEIDLDQSALECIPDKTFDAIIFSHVLEHLQNPLMTLEAVCRKLVDGGTIYIEFPSLKSLGLPSRAGTLQFCDDHSHIHLPNPYEVANTLLKGGVLILDAKTRRDPVRILGAPLFWLINMSRWLTGKKLQSKGLWDIYGFAFYLHGIKTSHKP